MYVYRRNAKTNILVRTRRRRSRRLVTSVVYDSGKQIFSSSCHGMDRIFSRLKFAELVWSLRLLLVLLLEVGWISRRWKGLVVRI
jgi:hypothetical protein